MGYCENCNKGFLDKNKKRHFDTKFHKKCQENNNYGKLNSKEKKQLFNKLYYEKTKKNNFEPNEF